MPTVRKLPDTTTLRRLRQQGYTQKEIADTYGAHESAVWKALSRAGFIEPSITYRDILPWEIAQEHKATAIMERFRSIVKQRKNSPLRQDEETMLNNWLEDLKANNLVVAYHREAPPNSASSKGGFYYVPRSPEDEWIIRRPVSPS